MSSSPNPREVQGKARSLSGLLPFLRPYRTRMLLALAFLLLAAAATLAFPLALRTLIDEYTFDKQKAPQTLEDLVREGYLRQVPIDPITGSNQTWRVIMEDSMASVNQNEPGIFDVRSGSDQISLEGTPYSEW